MDAKRILALDPANCTGFAHSNGDRGVWNLVAAKGEHQGDRLNRLADYIRGAYDSLGFDLIAFEDASFGSPNPNVQAMHNELAGIIKAVAAQCDVDARGVKPSQIKSFATGNGRAKKHEMIRAAKVKLGIDTTNDNVADALWILAFAEAGFPQLATKPKVRPRRASKKQEPQSRMF